MVNVEGAKWKDTGYQNFPSGLSEGPFLYKRNIQSHYNKEHKQDSMNRPNSFYDHWHIQKSL